MKSILPALILLFILTSESFGQLSVDSETMLNNQIQAARQLYDDFSGPQSRIYNGRRYVPYTFRREGHPFLLSEQTSKGWVSYEGIRYDSLYLQFDIVRNQVVILDGNKKNKIVLQNDLVDSFKIFDHVFIKLSPIEKSGLKEEGFFQVLHNEKLQVVALRKKVIADNTKGTTVLRVFKPQNEYYILKNGKYHAVDREAQVLNVLADERNKVKSGLRQQVIRFKKNNFEEALLTAVTIYEN